MSSLPIGRDATVIFRQLFDSVSSTYSYLVASRHGGEALIIDPVLDDKLKKFVDFLVKEVETKKPVE